jgi:hypothetical protein
VCRVNYSRELVAAPEPSDPTSAPRIALPALAPSNLPALSLPDLAGPLVPANGSSPDNIMRALVVQMTSFHQQMFEQNQQTISMIVQLFSRMHREHVGLIRDELSRLDQLTEEFRLIQRELTRVSAARGTSQAQSLVVAPGRRDPARDRAPDYAQARQDQPGHSESDATSHRDKAQPKPVDASAAAPSTPPPADSAEPPIAPVGSAGEIPSALVPPGLTNPEEIHVWLVERMAAIESERQTLWQRVFNAFKMP